MYNAGSCKKVNGHDHRKPENRSAEIRGCLPARLERLRHLKKRYLRLVEEDRAMGKLAEKELKAYRKTGRKGIPWERVRQNLGL